MNILVFGSGGREHALALAIRNSKKCNNLFVAPGNGGTAQVAQNVALNWCETDIVTEFIKVNKIGMVVIGPEEPLVLGFADTLNAAFSNKKLIVIGPSKLGAQLEGSKAFSKKFMARHNIPTARYQEITNLQQGVVFLKTLKPPYVLKADGLAAGKGVVILEDLNAATMELDAMLNGKFGAASKKVVIEEFLSGIEFSVFALTDGKDYVLLPEAKDYKRIGEGDTGLNTGGMGAVSPVNFFTKSIQAKVIGRIIEPTIKGLQTDKLPYVGIVFFGLILVGKNPFVIEYNCRLGDPETQVILMRLKNDLVNLFENAAAGNLKNMRLRFDKRTTLATVLSAGGYPEKYNSGDSIQIHSENTANSYIFHAGTTLNENNVLVTSGGRVMSCVAMADSIEEAAHNSQQLAESVQYKGKYFRHDIGLDIIGFHQKNEKQSSELHA